MSAPPPRNDRLWAVDALKLALAVMVVGIHADPFAGLGRVLHLLTAEGLFRLGVPVFLIFNGYYLHAGIEAGRGRPWLLRVLRLYVIWMLLYLPVYWQALAGMEPGALLRLALFGYWHLWYLAGLVFAGALLLALAHWPTGRLALLAGAAFALGVAVTWGIAAGLVHPGPLFSDPLQPQRNPLVLSLPCLIAGFLMRRLRLPDRLPSALVRRLVLAGLAALLAESLLLGAMPVGVPHDSLASLGLAAPALALAALQGRRHLSGRAMADYSGGIYFLHVAFVALLFRHSDLAPPLVWLIAIAGSALLTAVLRRAGLARHLF